MVSLLSAEWLYLVVAIGVCSLIIVTIITIHSTIKQKQEAIGNILSRSLYIIFYISGLIACIAFAFLRTNLLLPMGTVISCHIGYYLSINGVYIGKVLLFIIFLYRIDLAFHQSALAYHRGFLSCVMITYILISSVLNAFYCIICWSLINFQQLNQKIGICTTLGIGTPQQHSKRRLFLGAICLADIVFSIFVCCLFVYKLRVVIKMSKNDHNHNSHSGRDLTLVVLARKQTMLVILACFSSLLSIGISTQVSGFGLLVSLDVAFNTFCVWLMFNFTQKYWVIFIKYVCCCCYCCVYKEDFLVTLKSISHKYSVKRSISSIQKNLNIDDHYVQQNSISKPKEPPLPVIPESKKHNNIEINFDNAKNITPQDIMKNSIDTPDPEITEDYNQPQIELELNQQSNESPPNVDSKSHSDDNVYFAKLNRWDSTKL